MKEPPCLLAQYFLNHRLDPAEVERQVEALADVGYQGVLAHARQGLETPYFSAEWWQALERIMAVCRRRGIGFWIWDDDYYPSGLAGGRVVWENPGLIARGLDFDLRTVSGAGPFTVDFGPGMLLRAFAVEHRGGKPVGPPLDVTAACGTRRLAWGARFLKHSAYSPPLDSVGHPHWRATVGDNHFALAWRPPRPADYTIIGVRLVSSAGVHPDILRPEGIARFLELTHEVYRARYPADLGRLLAGVFTDEPSPGAMLFPWTDGFPAAFRADHGYELADHFAHLAMDIDERSPAVRHHYRLTQHRLQADNYVARIGRWCAAHGLAFAGHLTRTEWFSLAAAWWPNELRLYRGFDIPCADPLGGSCGWRAAAAYHSGLKVASSAAHLFGKRQAGSDALAVMGDETSLRDLKFALDYQLVMGINCFAVHGLDYSLDGPRKDEAPPSLFYQHTQWPWMGTLTAHVRRTAAHLTGGRHCCETALLYPATALAAAGRPGSDWFNQPDEQKFHRLVDRLLSCHGEFDFIDEATLCENSGPGPVLTTPEPYRVIVVAWQRFIDRRSAAALVAFARAGGRVIVIGRRPAALGRLGQPPETAWLDNPGISFHPRLDAAALAAIPRAAVSGRGAGNIFLLQREKDRRRVTFIVNRGETGFRGRVNGTRVSVPARGSLLLAAPAAGAAPVPLDPPPAAGRGRPLPGPWTFSCAANLVPLNFWHVGNASAAGPARARTSPFAAPGFDLMKRDPDPAGPGEDTVRYYCRFMLGGRVPDARLVIDESAFGGRWRLSVNGRPVSGWEKAAVHDCLNRQAPIGRLLRGGATPEPNTVCLETGGPGRGLAEIPFLYGAFTCRYRYGHLSFPFLDGGPLRRSLKTLLPLDVLGLPTFSGTVAYETRFTVTRAGDYLLDLGRVEDLAVVAVDGRQAAVLAWPPYRCRLGPLAAGEHRLLVTVANGPANRNRAAGLPAGLLGPVTLAPASRAGGAGG